MSVRQRVTTAILAACALALVSPTPRAAARQASAIDPPLLSSLTWRPLQISTDIGAPPSIVGVTTDSSFPYGVCATTADSILCQDPEQNTWTHLPVRPGRAVAFDPLDAAVFYTSDFWRGHRQSRQMIPVSPTLADDLRTGRAPDAALAFSRDGRTLFAGTRAIWRTTDGGNTWTVTSPALAADASDETISALAPSPVDSRALWAGTTEGRLHVTRDTGVTWRRVDLPAALGVARIAGIEASRFDALSAYVTVVQAEGSSRLLRTRDLGGTWTDIGRALPSSPVAADGVLPDISVVREDPFRRGLLFAATSRSVFFSIDDGESWQSLKLNLPDVPVRDVVIHDTDLVVATADNVWILDDFSPLRQLTADIGRAEAFLFRPAQAWRVRAHVSELESATLGTPRETRAAHGTIALSYLLGADTGPITLEVIETATNDVIRRYSSNESDRHPADPLLARSPGVHRVLWDLRYTPPERDADAPPGARVVPGTYQVRLTTPARTLRQAVSVRMDLRVRTAVADLTAQRVLARHVDTRRADISRVLATGSNAAPSRVAPLEDALQELRRLAVAIEAADVRPAPALAAAAAAALERSAELIK